MFSRKFVILVKTKKTDYKNCLLLVIKHTDQEICFQAWRYRITNLINSFKCLE